MADKKISALTGATVPLAGSEVLPIVQSGSTVKVSVADLTAGRAVSLGGNSALSSPFAYAGLNYGIALTSSGNDTGYLTNQLGVSQVSLGGYYYGSGLYYPTATTYSSIDVGAGSVDVYANTGLTVGTNFTRSKIGSFTAGNYIPGTAAKGINFTANTSAAGMTSKLLNDYEEGTWTPTYVSSGVTFGYTQQKGSYVKIGHLVYAQFYLNVTASGTTTNQVTISGLPFTSSSVNNPYEQGFGGGWSTNTQPIAFTVDANATTVTLWKQNIAPAIAIALNVVGYQVGTLIYRAA